MNSDEGQDRSANGPRHSAGGRERPSTRDETGRTARRQVAPDDRRTAVMRPVSEGDTPAAQLDQVEAAKAAMDRPTAKLAKPRPLSAS